MSNVTTAYDPSGPSGHLPRMTGEANHAGARF